MKNINFLLIALVAIVGCDILSGKTEKKPFIEYKAGQNSQYEYTFSIQYPDSADFTLESARFVNTVVKKRRMQ